MTQMLSIGVDHGNYNTKSSDGLIYPSGYIASAVPPVADPDVLEFGGTFYSIGARRFAVQYDKCVDDTALILTLPALGYTMQQAGLHESEFALGAGLPLAAYSSYQDPFQRYLLRSGLVFSWRGEAYTAHIKQVRIYPQGYAAYLNAFNQFSRYESVTFLDIGGYTIDVFRIYRGRLEAGSTKSLLTGTIILLRRVIDELARLDIHIHEQQLARAMAGGPIEHRRQAEATAVIRQAQAEYVRDLANTLREQQIDAQTPVALIGGGAELLERELRDRMYVVGVLDKYANARGYRLWLERDLKL